MTTIRLQVVTFSGGQSANKHVNCISSEARSYFVLRGWWPDFREMRGHKFEMFCSPKILNHLPIVCWCAVAVPLSRSENIPRTSFPRPAGQSGQAGMLRNLFHIWPATGERGRGEWSRRRYLDIYAQHWPDMEPEIHTFGYCIICIDNLCCLQFCPSHIFVHCRAK